MKPYSEMTIEELLDAAGVQRATRDTYLYVNIAGVMVTMEKSVLDATPHDERTSYGYAREYMRIQERLYLAENP
jgi:hypothetical protein